MKQCPNCHQTYDTDKLYCQNCGTPLASTDEPQARVVTFCPHCGCRTDANVNFCPGCGRDIHQAPAAASPAMTAPPQVMSSAPSQNPFAARMQQLFRSPLFVIMSIFLSAGLLLQTFGYSFLADNELPFAFLSMFFSFPVILLVIIAVWLMFADARHPKLGTMTSAGLNLLKAYMIVQIVAVSLIILVCLFAGLILIASGSNLSSYHAYRYSLPSAAILPLGVVLLFLAAAVGGIGLPAGISGLMCFSSIHKGLKYGNIQSISGGKTFVVFQFIYAIFTILVNVSMPTIFNLTDFAFSGYSTNYIILLSQVGFILSAICIMKLNQYLDAQRV